MKKRAKKKVYRRLSDEQTLELYALCKRYVPAICTRYHVPECFADQVLEKVFENVRSKVERKPNIRNVRAFMRCSVFHSLSNAVRDKPWERFVSLDAPSPQFNGKGEELPMGFVAVISDGGAGAKRVRRNAEWCPPNRRRPRWLVLFYETMQVLDADELKVVAAFNRAIKKAENSKRQWPIPRVEVIRISGFRRSNFYAILKKIQMDFSQCFQAYRKFWRKKRLDTFGVKCV